VLSPSHTLLITSADKERERKNKDKGGKKKKARCEPETVGSKNCRTDRPSVLLFFCPLFFCPLFFSALCLCFFFVCWLLSRCLTSFFCLSDAGNEPGQSLCAGSHSEAGRPCGAALLLRTAQVGRRKRRCDRCAKRLWDGKKMVAAVEIMVARVEKKDGWKTPRSATKQRN
jgi:hypothetical protein